MLLLHPMCAQEIREVRSLLAVERRFPGHDSLPIARHCLQRLRDLVDQIEGPDATEDCREHLGSLRTAISHLKAAIRAADPAARLTAACEELGRTLRPKGRPADRGA